jgi:hypothetical protein
MLKPGGKMVYATCSVLPSLKYSYLLTFLTSEAGQNFKLLKDKSILAHKSSYDGFYMALLEKTISRKTFTHFLLRFVLILVLLKFQMGIMTLQQGVDIL